LKKFLPLLFIFLSCFQAKNPCNIYEEDYQNILRIDSIVNDPDNFSRLQQAWKNDFGEETMFHSAHNAFRFICSSSFGGYEVFMVQALDSGYFLTAKVIDQNGDTVLAEKIEITKSQWLQVDSQLEANCFWTMGRGRKRVVLDGEAWTLEGFRTEPHNCSNARYHFVHRNSPIDQSFIQMCKQISSLHPYDTTSRGTPFLEL